MGYSKRKLSRTPKHRSGIMIACAVVGLSILIACIILNRRSQNDIESAPDEVCDSLYHNGSRYVEPVRVHCAYLDGDFSASTPANVKERKEDKVIYSPPYDLGKEFLLKKSWKWNSDVFLKRHPDGGFRRVDVFGNVIRSDMNAPLFFFGLKIYEAKIYFSRGNIQRVDMSIFNKGDYGKDMESSALISKVWDVRNAIDMNAKNRKNPIRDVYSPVENVELVSLLYNSGYPVYNVRYATRDKWPLRIAEFLSVFMAQSENDFNVSTLCDPVENVVAIYSRRNYKNIPVYNGDVFIDNVPMVDQGKKGYCFAATLERLFRYYGFETDQYEFALMSNTKAGGGVDGESASITVDEACKMIGFAKNDLQSFRDKRFELILKGEVSNIHPIYVQIVDRIKGLDLGRANDANTMFNIVLAIESGHPILWGVRSRHPHESDYYTAGQAKNVGHQRLIIGYNLLTQEILYSDSWGAGHELKRLAIKDAFSITHSVSHIYRVPDKSEGL